MNQLNQTVHSPSNKAHLTDQKPLRTKIRRNVKKRLNRVKQIFMMTTGF